MVYLSWHSVIIRVKKYHQRKRLPGGEKEYVIYRASIPVKKAEEMGLDDDELLLVLARKPEWYHLMNWEDKDNREILWPRIPEKIRIELCSLRLAPQELCPKKHVPIIIHAPEKELKKLGLNPNKPITLEELEKKILEKHAKKTVAVSQPA